MNKKRSTPKAFARARRKNPTDAERRIWSRLRDRRFIGFKFRREHPVGAYTVDFVCLASRVVVELDGGQHALQATYDGRRDDYLRREQFVVLRFPDAEVLRNTDVVMELIWNALQRPITNRHQSADRHRLESKSKRPH